MTLGEKLKEARKQANLSQEQLAEQLIISRSAIAKWEADLGTPDIENLKALSQLLNISIDNLLNDAQTLEDARNSQPESIPDTYCGKSCEGCTYRDSLNCCGCKSYLHSQPGGCAIARCCKDRSIDGCFSCGYRQRCNKLQAYQQSPALRLSAQKRHEELKIRNETILARVKDNLIQLSKQMPILYRLTMALLVCSIFSAIFDGIVPKLELWMTLPYTVIRLLYALMLLRMIAIHDRYRIAGWCGVGYAILNCANSFFPEGSIFFWLFGLGTSATQLVSEYHEFNAHADMLQDVDGDLSDNWRKLWYRQTLFICGGILSTFLMAITLLGLFALTFWICMVGILVTTFQRWIYLSRSAKLFQDYPIDSLLNRVRHRLSSSR